ncbi:MAG: 50S ribosomal protein L6 [Candidatus Pacebacteria bacterium]|nr:50S ribosomal protein L6 [Candidatus Paceibacterota bacterium]MCD8508026.1 50S ribosomal protein L6 [Candidatus Paceibacterota bacterium]MCD8528336.1 50S ribosomal protein L6 [Candidatus Paceibacterota bacterium]MCD8563806.1 50S ribosomal protein L6 [Candidatus Paceibacterota bacterium]
MSRLAKKPIIIPEKTTVTFENRVMTVAGPKGTLTKEFSRPIIDIQIAEGEIILTPTDQEQFTLALWGTYASHIINMIEGVNNGFEKKLILEGVGYKIAVVGSQLEMALGFSHPVHMPIPEGIEVTVEKNTTTIKGIDKELVGAFAADVRAQKKPEPYKGKGMRYFDEIIRRKQGKKSA